MDVTTNGSDVFANVEEFLRRFAATAPKRRSRLASTAPVAGFRLAALHHPDAFARRACLGSLDHYADDCSGAVFARALADPVEPVRHIALHSIACERCRTDDLCAPDVAPLLADRDPSARDAVERATEEDPDELVRDSTIDGGHGACLLAAGSVDHGDGGSWGGSSPGAERRNGGCSQCPGRRSWRCWIRDGLFVRK